MRYLKHIQAVFRLYCVMKPYDLMFVNSSKPIHKKYKLLVHFCKRKNENFNFKLLTDTRISTAISKKSNLELSIFLF